MNNTKHAPNDKETQAQKHPGRRAVLVGSTLALAAPWIASPGRALAQRAALDPTDPPTDSPLRMGIITDVHYADAETRGNRHYRDSLKKIDSAVSAFRGQADAPPVDLAFELGDFIDALAGEVNDHAIEAEIQFLRTIDAKFATSAPERHYVLGNHCVHTLTKREFADNSGAQPSYYSFDRDGWHFVLLDCCFTSDATPYQRANFDWRDANIPDHELAWLESDLSAARGPAIILTHQRLEGDDATTVRNAAAVRTVIEQSGKVAAVLQGHHHVNHHVEIAGIHYVVARAMVEGPADDNNAYAIAELHPDGSLAITGFADQHTHTFGA